MLQLRGDVRSFERPRQLARFLAEQALGKFHRVPLQLGSAALDELGQVADSRLVVEAIVQLRGPLPRMARS